MSYRLLSNAIVLAEGEAGYCQGYYPEVHISGVPGSPSGDALRDWCKSWCARVEPDKIVAIGTYDDDGGTECYCYFSADNKPADFDNDADFKAKYEPGASFRVAGIGTGCVAGTDDDGSYTCYRNCAYNQCVSIYACLS
jgi:hypothetical protein